MATDDNKPMASRRRWPRLELFERLQCSLDSLDGAIHVIEVGIGGLSLECDRELALGTRHTIRLSLRGVTFELPCRVAHRRRSDRGYVTGFEFVDVPGEGSPKNWRLQAGKLIDMLTDSLTVE